MIEESVYHKLESILESLFRDGATLSDDLIKILAVAIANMDDQKKFDKGMGDIPLKRLLEGLKKKDQLKTVIIPDEEYEQFKTILDKSGIKNYSVQELNKDDGKMLIFPQSDIVCVENTIAALKAERGLITEIDPKQFFLLTEGKDISIITNLDAVELESIRYNSRALPFPYTVIENDEGLGIVFKEEDMKTAQEVLNKTAFNLSGDRGDLVREQIEYKIKGRQEVNIAVEEAEREAVIIDKVNPNNYIKATADDFIYYKNNKEVTAISRKEPGAVEAAYQRIEGLTEPVVITKSEFDLPAAEKRQLLESKTNIYPSGYSAMDANIERLNLEAHKKATEKYVGKFGIYNIENDKNSLDTILARLEEKQKAEAKEHSKSKDEIDR